MDLSDHFPICFEWGVIKGPFDYPFKFNRSWLEDNDFLDWFNKEWSSSFTAGHFVDIEDMCLTLRKLKAATKKWTKNKSDFLNSTFTNL